MSSSTPTALGVLDVVAEAIRTALAALPANDNLTPGARSVLASCANDIANAAASMAAHADNGAI